MGPGTGLCSKDKKCWEDGIMKFPEKQLKIVGEKKVITLFNKVLGKKKIYIYIILTEKNKGSFFPAQICTSSNYTVYFKVLQCRMLIISQ